MDALELFINAASKQGSDRHPVSSALHIRTASHGRTSGRTFYRRMPAGSVLVARSSPSGDGRYRPACTVVIVKHIKARTRAKTSINNLLRN